MLFSEYNGKFIDILLQGKYENEELVENFVEHIFNEKNIIYPEILSVPYFTNQIENGLLEQLFPLKTIPKNFNNHLNTFIDKKKKYFQINITINVNSPDILKDLEDFFNSFKYLIKNDKNKFLLTVREYYDNIDTFVIDKKGIKKVSLDDLEESLGYNLLNEYIKKQHNNFVSNFAL